MIFTLVVLGAILLAMLQERIGPEFVMLAALVILTGAGVISAKEALAGFSDASVIAIGSLLVVGQAMRATGAMEMVSRFLIGNPKPGTGVFRLLTPVAGLSAFMNNTPLVAFMIPIFIDLSKRLRVAPGQLLLPLSYAAILGGTITRIGTSTNLTVDGLIQSRGLSGFSMFELAWVGLPVTIIGLVYLTTIGQRLLPQTEELLEHVETNPREYTVELLMSAECPFVGKSVRESGLRDLPGLYLYRIERGGEIISPVTPHITLQAGDCLSFSGVVSTVVDLQRIRGLTPIEHRPLDPVTDASLGSMEGVPVVAAKRRGRQLCEVVIGWSSPLVGHTIKDIDFRTRYSASIIAVHRTGEKLQQKIGQIELEAGDTLLVDADVDFTKRWRNSGDFILVSGVEDSHPVAHERGWLALAIFFATIVSMTVLPDYTPILTLSAAVLMVVLGCVSSFEGYRAIEMPILLLVASALGVSRAMDKSGAAEWVAGGFLNVMHVFGPLGALAGIVVATGLMTELLSNNAAAAIMATFSIATAQKMGVDPRPYIIAATVTASYGFATPIGYQTNLMVMNAGSYRFKDYLRAGIPLDLITWTATIVLVALFWGVGTSP